MTINYRANKLKILEVFLFVLIVGFSMYSGVREVVAGWDGKESTTLEDWTSISISDNGQTMVASSDYSVYVSTDAGETWEDTLYNGGSNRWTSVDVSGDGSVMAAVGEALNVYVSIDSGQTWNPYDTTRYWSSIALSYDGSKMVAAVNEAETTGYFYYSVDTGQNWANGNQDMGAFGWRDVAVSANGNIMVTVGNSNDEIYLSLDTGAYWSAIVVTSGQNYGSVDISSDGGYLVFGRVDGQAYTSDDLGVTQLPIAGFSNGINSISSISVSDDGTKIALTQDTPGYIKISTDSGSTWVDQIDAGQRSWREVSMSPDGQFLAAVAAGSYIYVFEPDTTAPTITSVSSDKTNGYYKVGDVIDIDVTFSENVTSTGNVTVTLETGDVDRTCTFTVSNSSFGTCNYTVQAGDTSADLTVASISGTIADQSSNVMSDFSIGTNLAANKNLVIDTTAPSISITAPLDGATVSGSSVLITATASDTNLVGVQFKRDTSINIGSEYTTPDYEVIWDTTALPNGAQSLIAVARDLAGNYATSTVVSVIVDNVEDVVDTGENEEVQSRRSSSRGSISWAQRNLSNQNQQTVFSKVDDLLVKLKSTLANDKNNKKTIEDLVEKLKVEFSRILSSLDSVSDSQKFTVDLELGDSHPQVKLLQQFLNNKGYLVAETGPGSIGMETEMFGLATRAAVIRFQTANGISPSVGYFGPITRGVANGL